MSTRTTQLSNSAQKVQQALADKGFDFTVQQLDAGTPESVFKLSGEHLETLTGGTAICIK